MQKILKELKVLYPLDEEEKLKSVIDYALMTFTFLTNRLTLKESDLSDLDLQWIKHASIEILNRSEETLGVIMYSELGYLVKYDSAYLSKSLQNMLFPKVKV